MQIVTHSLQSTQSDLTNLEAMKTFTIIVLTILVFTLTEGANTKLPYFLQLCHRSDPELNACIQESIELLRPKLAGGVPELFIPPVEPLEVPEIKVDQNSGPVYVHSTYRNILIHGLSRFTVRDVRFDLKHDKFMVKFWFPNIFLTANYTVNGKIMMMPLYGQGGCRGNFSDVDVTSYVKGERYKKNGNFHIRIKNVMIKYNIGNSNIHLDNLFNGDKTLGATMNTFLNENWKSVASEIEPVIQDAMSQMLHRTSENLFENFSIDQILPE